MINKNVGYLKVLSLVPNSGGNGRHFYYLCECKCRKIIEVRSTLLKNNKIISCGCERNKAKSKAKSYNLLGEKFGKLLVIQKLNLKDKVNNNFWLALCDCGNTSKYRATDLVRKTKQCRICGNKSQAEKMKTHGLSKTRKMNNFWKSLYRVQKRKALPKWANKDKIKQIYKNCPNGLCVDHIIPLRGKDVCGLHVPENLQYLTISENSKKINKFQPIYERI
jgi:hypothetical protein